MWDKIGYNISLERGGFKSGIYKVYDEYVENFIS